MFIMIIITIGFILGILLAYLYEMFMYKIGKKLGRSELVIVGYKLHHSIYGLIPICIAVFFIPDIYLKSFFLAFGVGIIVQHYFTGDGLVFVTKAHK